MLKLDGTRIAKPVVILPAGPTTLPTLRLDFLISLAFFSPHGRITSGSYLNGIYLLGTTVLSESSVKCRIQISGPLPALFLLFIPGGTDV